MGGWSDRVVDGVIHDPMIGLDYVHLDGGWEIEDTAYGEAMAVHQSERLYAALVAAVLRSPLPLRGHEVVFLRGYLDLGRGAFARLIGCAAYQLSEWEDDDARALPAAVDRRVRALVAERCGVPDAVAEPSTPPPGTARRAVLRFDAATQAWSGAVTAVPRA